MSKELVLNNKRRSYSFHDPGNHETKQKSYHPEKSKSKLFQKGYPNSKSHKLNPYKQKRESWVQRKLKREMNKGNLPPTPHNTTQFIVDAVYYPTDPYIYEFDSNKLEYNFQHHAMAGSMMDLMQQRLNTEGKEGMTVENEGGNSPFFMPKLRTVKSADDGIYEAYDSDISDHKSYDQFLNDAKNGKNLENVIKLLVGEIRKKDDQINSLLFDTNKQAFLQES